MDAFLIGFREEGAHRIAGVLGIRRHMSPDPWLRGSDRASVTPA